MLEKGDAILECGNSLYTDSQRRFEYLQVQGHRLSRHRRLRRRRGRPPRSLDHGRRPEEQWKNAQPILEAISAKFNGEPCCAYLGEGGAGHFVKMIHNGIEYGDMQMIAEVYGVMRDGLGMSPAEIREGLLRLGQGARSTRTSSRSPATCSQQSSPRPASRWSI